MKLSDFLKGFEGLDPNLIVISASDDEGNSFRRVFYEPTVGTWDEKEHEFETEETDGQIINAVCID